MKPVGKRVLSGFRTDSLELQQYDFYEVNGEISEYLGYWHRESGLTIEFIIKSKQDGTITFHRGISMEGESRKRRIIELHFLHELKQYVEDKHKVLSVLRDTAYEIEEKHRKKESIQWFKINAYTLYCLVVCMVIMTSGWPRIASGFFVLSLLGVPAVQMIQKYTMTKRYKLHGKTLK